MAPKIRRVYFTNQGARSAVDQKPEHFSFFDLCGDAHLRVGFLYNTALGF